MPGRSVAQKLIDAHLVSGKAVAGEELGLRVDQCLLTDTNGNMAWLQFEAMGFPRVKPARVVSYIDHNVYQTDSRNTDDHRYMQTASARTATRRSAVPQACSPSARAVSTSRWPWAAAPTTSPCPE